MENTERTRTITWLNPKAGARDAASISGLDYLRSIIDGKISPPPAAILLGYKIVEARNGFAAFEINPQEYHYNPFAMVHGGIISTVLDSTMTASILTTLPKGVGCSTAEIKVNFIRQVTAETGILRCEASPIHIGKRLAVAEGRVKDREDNLYAYGVTTCMIVGKTKE